jgi:hypothetical protein
MLMLIVIVFFFVFVIVFAKKIDLVYLGIDINKDGNSNIY